MQQHSIKDYLSEDLEKWIIKHIQQVQDLGKCYRAEILGQCDYCGEIK